MSKVQSNLLEVFWTLGFSGQVEKGGQFRAMAEDDNSSSVVANPPRSWRSRIPAILTLAGSVVAGLAIFSGNISTISENTMKLFGHNTSDPELIIRDPRIMNLPNMPSTPSRFWVEIVIEKKAGVIVTNCVQWIAIDGIELRNDTPISFDSGRFQKVVSVQFEWNRLIKAATANVRLVCDEIVTPWKELSTAEIQSNTPSDQGVTAADKAPSSTSDVAEPKFPAHNMSGAGRKVLPETAPAATSQSSGLGDFNISRFIGQWIDVLSGETMVVLANGDVFNHQQDRPVLA